MTGMPRLCCSLSFCVLMLCSAIRVHAQESTYVNDSNLVATYRNAIGLNARLFNGPEYHDYSNGVKEGIPYFGSKDYQPGSIVFDSILYTDVQLRLDVVNEYLTILHPP